MSFLLYYYTCIIDFEHRKKAFRQWRRTTYQMDTPSPCLCSFPSGLYLSRPTGTGTENGLVFQKKKRLISIIQLELQNVFFYLFIFF